MPSRCENENLAIRKRLFMTATPRHYDVTRKDKEGDAQLVYSMDIPETNGARAYTSHSGRPQTPVVICDYRSADLRSERTRWSITSC